MIAKLVFHCFFYISVITAITPENVIAQNAVANSFEEVLKRTCPLLKYSYNDSSQTHNYSGNWDFDADGKADELYFIGNGGAHLYFHLRIILSSDELENYFQFI